jgi:ribulose-5-phosphate 4-epimerase/fuculose-1-phosphate aldolase|tara:strand:- start:166 stop:903 length:738 start_codon:yes stop_codon:yes gene_type:complete
MSDKLTKKKLSIFFKILAHHRIGDLTACHASILSNDKKSFFTNCHGHLFEEIRPKDLIKVKFNENRKKIFNKVNIAGYYIHRNIHLLKKVKIGAILHTHSENGIAISCLKRGFITNLNQSSMRFHGAVKYIGHGGMAINQEIGKLIAGLIDKNTRLIILRNHGVIILGETIEELHHLTFHFEKCASVQLKLMNKVKDLTLVNNNISKITAKQHKGFGPRGKLMWWPVGGMSWQASLRVLKKLRKI